MHSDLFQMNAMRARFYVNEPINVNGNDIQWFEINLVKCIMMNMIMKVSNIPLHA